MNPPLHNALWEMIDGVLVINLDQRPDRWAQFQQAARDIIPAEKLQRLPARLGRDIPGFGRPPWFHGRKRDRTWAARAGCVQSHRRALLKARDAGWRTVLVLEDDVTFAPEFPALANALASALQGNDWQVCYLGFTDPWSPSRRLADLGGRHELFRVHGCNTAHAYLVRESARDWILGELPDEEGVWRWLATHRAVDRWYQRQLGLCFPVACVSPSVVNQVAGFSDIVEQATHYAVEDDHVRAVTASSSWGLAYRACQIWRRSSIRVNFAGDALRGWTRRINGF
jgi:glycosyl transferase, family 25